MAVFEYEGLDQAGKKVRGQREASDARELRSALGKEGIFLTGMSGDVTGERTARFKRSVAWFVGALGLAVSAWVLALRVIQHAAASGLEEAMIGVLDSGTALALAVLAGVVTWFAAFAAPLPFRKIVWFGRGFLIKTVIFLAVTIYVFATDTTGGQVGALIVLTAPMSGVVATVMLAPFVNIIVGIAMLAGARPADATPHS